MKTITLYTVAQKVEVGDSFTLGRGPGSGPHCSIGNGWVLIGVPQQPPRWIRRCDVAGAEYLEMDPELRELLEAPLRAELERRLVECCAAIEDEAGRELARRLADIRASAAREIERRCVEVDYLTSGPWWLRAWRAACGPGLRGVAA